jgi:hypothetical protein
VLLEIDWQGAKQVKLKVPDALGVFILPPSREALESRMRSRGQDSEETIARRLAAAREEMSHYDEFDFVIVNEDFDTAVCEMQAIFVGSRQRRHIQQAAPRAPDRTTVAANVSVSTPDSPGPVVRVLVSIALFVLGVALLLVGLVAAAALAVNSREGAPGNTLAVMAAMAVFGFVGCYRRASRTCSAGSRPRRQ